MFSFSTYSSYGLITKKHLIWLGVVVYNAYINGLLKGRQTHKAVEIFQRMKKDRCKPSAETYTLMINLYGKVC